MEEKFAYLNIKNFEDWQVSNYGYVLSHKGKKITPYMKNGALYFYGSKIINGKKIRINRPIAHLVYECFATTKAKFKDYTILYKDGNKNNCRIDNLFVNLTQDKNATQEQIDYFNRHIYICVKNRLKQLHIRDLYLRGLDTDNIIGNAVMWCWKYLPTFAIEKATNVFSMFHSFVNKYVDFAFKKEYAYFKRTKFYQQKE